MMHVNNTTEISPTEKRNNETQTNSEPFEKDVFVLYNCSYYMKHLSTFNDLEEHRISCKLVRVSVSRGKYEVNENDIDYMTKMIFSAYSNERFPCKTCTQDFESDSMLQLHLLLGHKEHWK